MCASTCLQQGPAVTLSSKDCSSSTHLEGACNIACASLGTTTDTPSTTNSSAGSKWPSSALQQFCSLLQREVKIITRNPFDVAGRLVLRLAVHNLPVSA